MKQLDKIVKYREHLYKIFNKLFNSENFLKHFLQEHLKNSTMHLLSCFSKHQKHETTLE